MTATQTPGVWYFIRQDFPSLRWQVTTVDEFQARSMRERGEKLYKSSAQAYLVRDKLEKKRQERCESISKS